MAIFYVLTLENMVDKSMARLEEAHDVLANHLEKDEMDLEEANNNTHLVEMVLRVANPEETSQTDPLPIGQLVLSMAHTPFLVD
jgi:hypothetical protein